MPIRYALSNSFGFGGTNAALLFRSWYEAAHDAQREARLEAAGIAMKIAVCIKQVPTREWQPRLDRRPAPGSASRTPASR